MLILCLSGQNCIGPGAGDILHSSFASGKPLADELFHAPLFLGPEQSAVDAALDRIEELQPILQRRFGHGLPRLSRRSRAKNRQSRPTCRAYT